MTSLIFYTGVGPLKPVINLSIVFLTGLITVFVASFGDEIAAFTFSFAQVNQQSMENLSFLMSATLIGSLCAAPVAMLLLRNFEVMQILIAIFCISILALIISANFPISYVFYAAAFLMGMVSGIFWSVLSIVIPSYFKHDRLADINKFVQSIRNAGYISAPFLAGILTAFFGATWSLGLVSILFIVAIPCSLLSVGRLAKTVNIKPHSGNQAGKKIIWPQVLRFFQLPGMKITLLPLIVTICTTSTFNVAFMYLLLINLHYSQATYGLIVSAISIGLMIGPIVLTSWAKKHGMGFAACMAATTVGFSVCLSGAYQSIPWLYVVLLILGMANGLQNVLMSTFVMQIVPAEARQQLMPTHIFIIQASVLTGFIIAGQVPVASARLLLIIAGIIAISAGLIGAAGNLVLYKKEELPYQ
ncbi:MFS transporter [Fastidiosibacter lacustris]|uniref:MFS transporter n=1 Tax=Fastidiosibacter lacustris TaxID=2056695 RepID=UPI000E34DBDD|nr:MFS transporter [Fastidiosibacter lacustris]